MIFLNLLGVAISIWAQEKAVTKIGGYQISPSRTLGELHSSHLDRLDKKLKPTLLPEVGKELNSDRLLMFKKNIESSLNTSDRVGARVIDIRTQPMNDSQVLLEFIVDPGDRVTFGFIGNKTFSKGDLGDLIDEQKQTGLGRDYVDSIKQKIESFYRDRAFTKVSVSVRTQESPMSSERKVIYMINEGERHRIVNIVFEGTLSFSQEILKEKFYEKAPVMVEKGYFSEKETEKTAQSLVEWIRSQGFLSSRLVTLKNSVHETDPSVDLKVYISEGDQTIVRRIDVSGSTVLSAQELHQTLGLVEGAPLNIFSFNDGIEALKLKYRNLGYLSFKIENEGQASVIGYSNKNRWADIQLNFQEGPQYVAGEVKVDGAQLTKEEIILRELQYSEGEVLEERRIFESEARLRRLGIFADVKTKLDNDPVRPGVKNIIIQVQEAQRGMISTGFGYRNDLGLRVFGDLTYANLFRSNHTYGLGAFVNRRLQNVESRKNQPIEGIDYEARMNYIWPWFIMKELTFRPEIVQRGFRYELFRDDTTQFSLSFEKPIYKKWGLSGLLNYTLQRTRQFDAINSIDNAAFTVGSITPSVRIDFRDSPLNPTKGFFLNLSYEIASPSLGAQVEPVEIAYHRILSRTDIHVPVVKAASLYFSVRTGFARNLVDPAQYLSVSQRESVGIPLFKQFALGGINSVRGFTYQGINVGNRSGQLTDFSIQGTLSYVNYRTQIDFPVSDSLKMGPFFDAANLLVDEFSFGRDMRYGAGFGIRYMTPVGPANFDWGFNLDQRVLPVPGSSTGQLEPSNQFYFSLGVI